MVNLQCLSAIINYTDRQYKVSIMRGKLEKTQNYEGWENVFNQDFFSPQFMNPEYCHLIATLSRMKNKENLDSIKVKYNIGCGNLSKLCLKVWKTQWIRVWTQVQQPVSAVSWLCCLKENHWTSQNLFPCVWGWAANSILTDLWGRSSESVWKAPKNHRVPLKWEGLWSWWQIPWLLSQGLEVRLRKVR